MLLLPLLTRLAVPTRNLVVDSRMRTIHAFWPSCSNDEGARGRTTVDPVVDLYVESVDAVVDLYVESEFDMSCVSLILVESTEACSNLSLICYRQCRRFLFILHG